MTSAALAGAAAGAAGALAIGRADRTMFWIALVGAVAGVAGAYTSRPSWTPGSPGTAHGDRLDTVIAAVARPVPLDEVLQQVVDTLRQGPGRRRIELWQVVDGDLVLTHHQPPVDRARLRLDPAAVSAAANAGVVGDTWLRTWLPGLVDAGSSEQTRAVPLSTQGQLAGCVVLRREPHDPPFGTADDERLARVRRPVAAAINQASLTIRLERSVEELRRRNDELQASRARLVTVADQERRRLERNLHDGAQARLNALGVRLQLVRKLAEAEPRRLGELLDEIGAELLDATTELRTLAHGIVPPLLLTGGLGDALRDAASRLPLKARVDVHTTDRFRPDVETAVYYCAVEALQNTLKHAGPDASAVVELRVEAEGLCLVVEDDGVGFDVATATGGQGLVNLTDRIGALGGSVVIGSGGPRGVRVEVHVPLEPTGDVADR